MNLNYNLSTPMVNPVITLSCNLLEPARRMLGDTSRGISYDLGRDVVVGFIHYLTCLSRQWTNLATDAVLESMITRQLPWIDNLSINLLSKSSAKSTPSQVPTRKLKQGAGMKTYRNNPPLQILDQETPHMFRTHTRQLSRAHIIQ